MENLFAQFDFPIAMCIVLCTTFGVALKKLWSYFTNRIDNLEKRVDYLQGVILKITLDTKLSSGTE